MIQTMQKPSKIRSALVMMDLIYHSAVRDIRKTHRNAMVGLIMSIVQTLVFIAAFYLMFSIIGARGASLRGDFLLYLMSGIFLFLTHTKALSAVIKSEGPASPMMQHAPLNTVITISAAAISSLYIQILTLVVVLFLYHVIFTPIVINDPLGAIGMVLLSWFSGLAIGMMLLAVKPWAPDFVMLVSTIYSRANMVASGKMFVANSLPASLLPFFDWNPLFHTIDQARGFVFLNYHPHNSSVIYPVLVSVALIMIGMMGEFYTRRNVSASWSATR
ncbi:MAG: ABC transporter permease [Rhodobacteraceae bacterium]|nr:ABC transporter permease [Paracoccaceae bacterium]